MLAMFLYGIGIMYSPGPVNILALNIGITNKIKKSFGFYIGIGLSMLMYSLLLGFTGEKIVKKEYLLYLSIIGSGYIMYLAIKIWKSKVIIKDKSDEATLKLKSAFIIQSLNPKAMLAILPLVTIYFPTNNIVGFKIILASLVIFLLALAAPFVYSVAGRFLSKLINQPHFFNIYNKLMAIFLIYVAVSIFKDHVFLVLTGINPY